jgi:hypothetical protein
MTLPSLAQDQPVALRPSPRPGKERASYFLKKAIFLAKKYAASSSPQNLWHCFRTC